jgi:hypothetical protein
MAESIHLRLERERKAALPEASRLRDFRNYARGRQKGTLTTGQQQILRSLVGQRFCHNVCKAILKAASGRLQLARFDVANAGVEEWLKDFWVLAQLPVVANQVHFATLRDGNHAVALSWDGEAGRVRLARERFWDGKQGIFIAYDEEDQPTYAVKEWKTEKAMRRVVWWPDKIQRYIADGNGWKPYNLPDGTPWEEKWEAGLPVVHFRNVYMPNDSSDDDADTSYGLSELDGGVLGLQDEINDVQRDITAAARYTGYQMLYGTGINLPKDATGKTIPPKVEPGAFFHTENAQGSYGTLPAGDLAQLISALNTKLRTIAQVTETPLHQITGGDWPSGEALLQADMPLVAKVETLGQMFGPAWASLAHKATTMANVFGNAGLDTDAMITTVFAPAERRDAFTRARIASTEAPHVSKREVLRLLGKSRDQQDEILKELEEEKKAELVQLQRTQAITQKKESMGAEKE